MALAKSISIAGRRIGAGLPPYVVAEMSANHRGDLSTAIKIIEAAKKSGADAVKLQTYTPDTITLDCDSDDFRIRGGLWDGRTLHDLYSEAHTPWAWHGPLFEEARRLNVTIFSSPFDRTAVDLLEDLNAPAYKIASFEAIDLPLIRYVASTGKPMIISTGMADANEIGEAVETAKAGGCEQLAILHCVSGYPAPASDYNLLTIPDLVSRFGLVTGLSDHTLDSVTAVASIALGASIVEKHFTLDRTGGGPDDVFSLEPGEFASLCHDVWIAWEAIGHINYERKPSEIENVRFRRSLYFVTDLPAGSRVTEDCIRSIRPGYGMAPKHLDAILGRRVKCSVTRGTPVRPEHFEDT